MQKPFSMMSNRLIAALCTGTIVAGLGAGCQKKTEAVPQPAVTTQPPSLTPEESFAQIVETFRRGMEEIPIHFVAPDASGGHSMMTGRIEVSHELVQPANETEKLKGIITVRSQMRYSLKRSNEAPATGESESDDLSGVLDDESDTQVFDPALVETSEPSRTTSRPGKPEVTVASEENKSERKYELVYEDGRWVLTTKLDPETEKSVQNAFEHALSSQG
jgi:hypothetical protein